MVARPVTGSRPADPVVADADGGCPVPASMLRAVLLTKREVFGACQALADADPVLVAAGYAEEARALGDLFELLEDRLTRTGPPLAAGGSGDRRDYEDSGRNSMDRELTQ